MKSTRLRTRHYEEKDVDSLKKLLVELQDYIASIDPHKRNRPAADFDPDAYLLNMFTMVKRENGFILVAETEEGVSGCLVGSIRTPSEIDRLEKYPDREGIIHELSVLPGERKKGVGKALMDAAEKHLKAQKCDFARVGCFSPNTGAHSFYEKCGYEDRFVEMLKKL